ncbi:MAG: single-stranded DNA-binding protein [Clostridia bacterium]|nr:single-stranded DNA-binding protein [Clostridia bacterium]
MQKYGCCNAAYVVGDVVMLPVYSHSVFNEAFYNLILRVSRLSGTADYVPITVSGELLSELDMLCEGERLSVSGQLRSYNKLVEGSGRLVITVFGKNIIKLSKEAECDNEIRLVGSVCKPVVYRKTPLAREITDILLAVNRAYGKSDYLPCIAWGKNARSLQTLSVGDSISIVGRLQSREYTKRDENGNTSVRTAYEVSINEYELL